MDYKEIIDSIVSNFSLYDIENAIEKADTNNFFNDINTENIVNSILSGDSFISQDNILKIFYELFVTEIKSALHIGCDIILICILIGLLSNISSSFGKNTVSSIGVMICSFVIITLCIGSFYQAYDYCQDTIAIMTQSMEILLPVIIPILIAMGGISSGSLMSPIMLTSITGFNFILNKIILPMMFISAIFSIINSITEKDYIKKLSVFLRRTSLFLTGFLVTVFTGITAIQGIVSKSADGILMKTAKFSVDNFVPIVGGFAADSIDMIISCLGLIKNVAGIMGVILILATITTPLIKLLAIILIYKITAVIVEPITEKKISDCLNEMGTSLISMTVILALSTLMFLLFITIIMSLGGSGN